MAKKSLLEMIQEKESLEKEIEIRRVEELNSLVEKIHDMIKKSVFGRSEVMEALERAQKNRASKAPRMRKQPGQKAPRTERIRAPYKYRVYRHPDNSDLQWTKTGPAKMPDWLSEAVAKGIDIENWRIE